MSILKNSIAVVLDDHKMFADAFSALIERADLFRTVLTFNDEQEVIHFLVKNSGNNQVCFFVDYYLKDKHSLPIINDAKRICKHIKIIVVSSVIDPMVIQNILFHNPDGLLSKSSGFNETLECMHSIESNSRFISPCIQEIINNSYGVQTNIFTPREIEILQHFDQGFSNFEIAEKLYLSKHTVIAHRRHMMGKVECKTIIELLAFSRKNGLI